jgi:hypothetical protein
MRIVMMLCTTNATKAAQFRRNSNTADAVKRPALHVSAMELFRTAAVGAARGMGETNCVFFPSRRPVHHCLTAKLTNRRLFAARRSLLLR